MSRYFLIAFVLWLALMASLTWLMFSLRDSTRAAYATGTAQAEWDEWRDEARRQSTDEGPVKRRVPKSERPPALVLMEDFFAVCLVGVLFFSTLLYAATAYMAAGALRRGEPAAGEKVHSAE